MKMNDKLIKEVNAQMNRELMSAYIYLAMSSHAAGESLNGVANWLKVQAMEEFDHAMGFHNHLLDRGAPVLYEAMDKPEAEFGGPKTLLEESLKHEQYITKHIHELYDMAKAEGDKPLEILLQWYVDEQVEEEASIEELLDKLKIGGDSGASILMLDKVLGERQYEKSGILK